MARPHAAAIVEDAWHRQVDRVLRRRGWRNRVIPHVGYGSQQQLHVLARVVLSRTPDADSAHEACEAYEQAEALAKAERVERGVKDPTFGGMRSAFLRNRGWRSFITAPAMDVPVTVRVGDQVAHSRSDRSGNVDVTVAGHGLPPGWHEVSVEALHGAPVTAPVNIIGDDVRFGLVSDIDDTVISTSLPRPLIAAWNTFVLSEGARHGVPGMAPLYRDLLTEHPGAPVVYVSTGAWNTAPTLTRFLKSQGYPAGALLLTDWGPTNTGWFRSGQDHKRASLDRLARDFPNIRWGLVGDDGQHDPVLYEDFADARPDRVAWIAIRQLTPAEQVLSHGLPVSTEELVGRNQQRVHPRSTAVFQAPDGYGLQRLLHTAGLMAADVEPLASPVAPTPPTGPDRARTADPGSPAEDRQG